MVRRLRVRHWHEHGGPAAKGQFAWPNSNAVPFEIKYDANLKYAWLQVSADPDHTIAYDLGSAPFTPDALTTLRFGRRATQLNSSIRVANLVLEVESQAVVALTNVFEVLSTDGYKSGMLSGLPLSRGSSFAVMCCWLGVRPTYPEPRPTAVQPLRKEIFFLGPPLSHRPGILGGNKR